MGASPIIAKPFTAAGALYTPPANLATPGQSNTGSARVHAVALRSSDGTTPVVVNIRAGTTVSDPIIGTIAATMYSELILPDEGVRADNGIFVQVVSGTVGQGVLYMS